jgi:beta-glucosidase/6-phospho-beta-glucosidase/beta-galactosidase
MIRVISMRKAVLAGVAGAVVWEVTFRLLRAVGFPLFDIVRQLGTLAFPEDQVPAWWIVGMAAHAAVGAIWAVFYAYFFWHRLKLPNVAQGMVFALLPAILALLIATPQLGLMHRGGDIAQLDPAATLRALQTGDLVGLFLGHLIYGAVLGSLYSRPVGYPSEREPRRKPRARTPSPADRSRRGKPGSGFIFATGVEGSYPTIQGGAWRYDQMETTGHYLHWQRDFELAREIGATHLRWGPPLHLVYLGPGRFDWTFCDEALAELADYGPEPIIDLCHFGLPTWLGNFQNPEVPDELARYAEAFARRYPWVRYYTPVNEMYVCAKLSALEGRWNDQRADERSFVTAAHSLALASIRMMNKITSIRPDAVFMNSESGEFFQPCCPDPEIRRIADLENERRFLPLDLIYGHPLSPMMRSHLAENGISAAELDRLTQRKAPARAILGVDYYEWNEKLIDSDGSPRALGELFGWYVIASQYYERYQRPMMHAETNRLDARDAPRWLWRQWHNVQLLRKAGVPLVGFTWYSLTDQTDWDIALTEPLGRVNPVGLFDLNRDIRPVGLAYRHLIETHAGLPEYLECEPLAQLWQQGEGA